MHQGKGFLYVHLSSAPGRARAVGESGVGTCGWPATCTAGTSLEHRFFLGVLVGKSLGLALPCGEYVFQHSHCHGHMVHEVSSDG